MRTDTLILGAGPAGLCHGFWRKQLEPETKIRIVDASTRAGGWVHTQDIDGFSCELGPQGIRPTDKSDALVEALGIGDRVVPADNSAKLRYVGRDGELIALPAGPKDLLRTPLFTLGGKLRLISERFRKGRPGHGESLAAFVGRRFGAQAVPLAEAMASGIFAGDARRLEVDAAFPKVVEWEREFGSIVKAMAKTAQQRKGPKRPVLSSFRGGMQTLADVLCDRVREDLSLGQSARRVTKTGSGYQVELDRDTIECEELVLALPAHAAARVLSEMDRELAAELTDVPFASVTNIYLGFSAKHVEAQLRGFGFLLERGEDSPYLGVLYCSSLFPGVAPQGRFLVRIMAGGSLHPEFANRAATDPTVVDEAAEMLRRYTKLEVKPVFQHVTIARNAIPQYVNGHAERVARVRQMTAAHEGLRLIGNSYDEVSVVGQMAVPVSQVACAAP